MLLAAAHRQAFSVLALPIQAELGVSLAHMGALHSAALVGYLVGQVPLGALSDAAGGLRVMLGCLAAWSAAVAATGAAAAAPLPAALLLLGAARVATGLFSAGIMPASGAVAARWFSPERRGGATARIYSCFYVGTAAGLVLTPHLAAAVGWAAALGAWGAAGVGLAAALRVLLRRELAADAAHYAARPAPAAGGGASPLHRLLSDGRHARHVAFLAWTHSVIGAGFFFLSAWVPFFIASLPGVGGLGAVGALSALPWVATAAAADAGGRAATALQRRGWTALRVRRAFQAAAGFGTAACLLPLALGGGAPPAPAAVAALVGALAWQGLNYSGFTAYVPDAYPAEAGAVLAATNTCGTLAGLAAAAAPAALPFDRLFLLLAALYFVSAAAWLALARGRPE